jgi:adenylate kinase family enzyme
MRFYRRKNVKIVYIKVGKQEAIQRNLFRGRPDDTKDSIAKRFDEFEADFKSF